MDGNTVRHIRELLKMNQEQFAYAMGYSKSHLSLVENDKHPITIRFMSRMLFVIRGETFFDNCSQELRDAEKAIADMVRK